jgi:hypothetical protein
VSAKVAHGFFFVLGLQLVVASSWALSLVGTKLSKRTDGIISLDPDALSSCIGAALAWVIVLCLWIKAHLRKRKRVERDARIRGYSVIDDDELEEQHNKNSYSNENNSRNNTNEHGTKNFSGDSPVTFSPFTVLFLSLTGALDELCYFPPLLISQNFTVLDLSLGALLACTLVMVVIGLFLSRCESLLAAMDRVPLWGVVFVYAVSLTIEAVRDCLREQAVEQN